jgi:probable phosphoglycerate mutase
MIIYLIRHGANPSLSKFLPGTLPGIHLNADGEKQANQVAECLRNEGLDAIYASPLERTVETAQPLAKAIHLPVIPEPGFMEMDTGTLTGMTFAELKENELWNKIRVSPELNSFPGGEEFPHAWERLWQTLESIRQKHGIGSRIAIFSHSDCIKMLIARAIGLPFSSYNRLMIDPASLTILSYHKEKFWLLGMNLNLPYVLPVVDIKKPATQTNASPVD